eukprot:6176987-Pleurochrysis_carterae.AAC.4
MVGTDARITVKGNKKNLPSLTRLALRSTRSAMDVQAATCIRRNSRAVAKLHLFRGPAALCCSLLDVGSFATAVAGAMQDRAGAPSPRWAIARGDRSSQQSAVKK